MMIFQQPDRCKVKLLYIRFILIFHFSKWCGEGEGKGSLLQHAQTQLLITKALKSLLTKSNLRETYITEICAELLLPKGKSLGSRSR